MEMQSLDSYLAYVEILFSWADVETLFIVWKGSLHLGRSAARIRNHYAQYIPDLAQRLGLIGCTTFKELIYNYDEFVYQREVFLCAFRRNGITDQKHTRRPS